MIISMPRSRLPVLGISVLGLVVAAAVAVLLLTNIGTRSTTAAQQATANDVIDMPPFEMTRTVTTDKVVATYTLRWEGASKWRDTLIASTTPNAEPGRYQELSGGKVTTFAHGKAQVTDAGPGIQVPAAFFADQDWLLGRFKDATVTQQGTEKTLRSLSGADFEEWTHDSTTGLVLAYQRVVNGKAVEEDRVVSLKLLSGQVIR